MREKAIRLLVVTDHPDDVQLLEEAFLELEDIRYSREWLQPVRRTYAVDGEEAVELADPGMHDVILLDLGLGGNEAMVTFQKLRERVPEIAIVLLAGEEEESIAMRLVRQGAQDYVLKLELDCVPLARALICAMARQCLIEGQRGQALVDDLTGLWNARGFELVGRTQLSMAARCGLTALVATAELDAGQRGDVEILAAADQLRCDLPEAAILARLSGSRFAALVIPGDAEGAARLENQFGKKMDVCCATVALRPDSIGDCTMQSTLQALCENVGVAAARAGRHL